MRDSDRAQANWEDPPGPPDEPAVGYGVDPITPAELDRFVSSMGPTPVELDPVAVTLLALVAAAREFHSSEAKREALAVRIETDGDDEGNQSNVVNAQYFAAMVRGAVFHDEPETSDEPAAAYVADLDTDPADSESLRRLRNLIDDRLGWRDVEQQERGDYEARLVEVGVALAILRDVWAGKADPEEQAARDVLRTAVFP